MLKKIKTISTSVSDAAKNTSQVVVNKTQKWATAVTETASSVVDSVKTTSSNIVSGIWEEVSKWSEYVASLADFWKISAWLWESKDAIFWKIEEDFVAATSLGKKWFDQIVSTANKVVEHVGENLEDIQENKTSAVSFIQKELQDSNVALLKDLNLEWEIQEKVLNVFLIILSISLAIAFPALIPEIIGVIIDPFAIAKICIGLDDSEDGEE